MNNPVRLTDPYGTEPEDWYKGKNGQVVWFNSSAETYVDDNGEKYKNIGKEYVFEGPKNVIYYHQNKITSVLNRKKYLAHVSINLDFSFIGGGGIEIGKYSDGDYNVDYITIKKGAGVNLSTGIEFGATKFSDPKGGFLTDIKGKGVQGNIGYGVLSFSQTQEMNYYRDEPVMMGNGAKYNEFSVAAGFYAKLKPVNTLMTTKTYISKPYKVDPIIRLKMAGL